jgi:hypothetical protein
VFIAEKELQCLLQIYVGQITTEMSSIVIVFNFLGLKYRFFLNTVYFITSNPNLSWDMKIKSYYSIFIC